MADRPEMFGPTLGFLGMADSMEPCKMLWAMATKFGLGAEIQSPTSLLIVTVKNCHYAGFWLLQWLPRSGIRSLSDVTESSK